MARIISSRAELGYIVGDFGCGEAHLSNLIENQCERIYNFDHYAINDSVIECDIANVPLDDKTIDIAVFCLSLMGSNFTEYIKEAHRTLVLDGRIHIFETTKRFSDLDQFKLGLQKLGFGQISIDTKYIFTHIVATKEIEKPRNPTNTITGLKI